MQHFRKTSLVVVAAVLAAVASGCVTNVGGGGYYYVGDGSAGALDGESQDAAASAGDSAATGQDAQSSATPDTSAAADVAVVADSAVADTSTPDTAVADTAVADTAVADTSAPDTAPPADVVVPTKPLPVVKLLDFNPMSATAGQTIGLEGYAGNYVVVLMGAGWCSSCNAQADFMQKIKKDLESKGRNDFVMVVINDKSAATSSYQKEMFTCNYSICAPKGSLLTFPILQGTSTYGWHSFVDNKGLKGVKNDCFIYRPDGTLVFKHVGKATVNLTQFEQEVRASLDL